MSRIVTRFTYAHPIERVWKTLTTRELIARWLMDNDFEPKLRHRFQVRAKPMPGWDGVINCEVLEMAPPSRLVWSWQGSNMKHATTVTFTLRATGEGTELTLVHEGFRGLGGFALRFMHRMGWKGKFLGKNLPALLAEAAATVP